MVCVCVVGGCEEEARCVGGGHVVGDPVVDWDDGFFFGDEAAADVYLLLLYLKLVSWLRGFVAWKGVCVGTHARKTPE